MQPSPDSANGSAHDSDVVRLWILPLVTAAILLSFCWVYPRAIVAWLGESNPWTSYLYLYGFGFAFFLFGIVMILRTGACKLGRGWDSAWFAVLIGGYVFFASLHALWIVLAQTIPFRGGA